MIRIFAVMYLKIWFVAASLDCSGCQCKIENGEYLYTINTASNVTYTAYSWSNATDHPVATKRHPSEPPVKSSSHEKLVSSRNLGNLTLKRCYLNENDKMEDEDFLCCASPHTDTLQSDVLGTTTASVNHESGQPGNWTAVAYGVAGAVVVAVAVAVAVLAVRIAKSFRIRRKKKKLEPSFTPVANSPHMDV